MPSLSDLAKEVPRINTFDMQALADQWRDISWRTFPEDFKNPHCDIVKFYQYVMKIEDVLGNCKYETFAKFALQVLSLPTSNVDAERLFSKLNLIKRKERSSLKLKTIRSLIHLDQYSRQHKEPSNEMLEIIRFKLHHP